MENNKIQVIEVPFEHPAEKVFDLPPGSTMIDKVVIEEIPPVVPIEYDTKDEEIDQQFQEVFNAAYSTFEAQRIAIEGMNDQFRNRALEVAQQFLNTALAAAKEKALLKQGKDKLKSSTSGSVSNTTNNIIMGRDDMLRTLMQQALEEKRTIDEQ